MTDLISRQAAINAVKWLSLGETDAVRLAMRIGYYLECLPTAQQSKLLTNITVQYSEVLCVNCKHCENRNNEEPYCHYHAMVVTPDYFCADGEEGEWMP